ncbi:MAG: heme-binding domain-containing protein [Bacteroidia bacterium]|nr:heme-binding domain-containing protein [Bacteroidia bacterium]
MKKILKRIALLLLAGLVVIQFIRPEKNQGSSVGSANALASFTPSEDVLNILKVSCNDCHSNYTNYPWYAEVQPVGWWLADHVNEGKEHLNFDDFQSYSQEDQFEAMEELIETIREGEMPLTSYTLTHHDAVLDESQKKALITWAEGAMRQLLISNPGLQKEEGDEGEKEDRD